LPDVIVSDQKSQFGFILEDVAYSGHLELGIHILWVFVVNGYIFPRFGILYQEKSGNPGSQILPVLQVAAVLDSSGGDLLLATLIDRYGLVSWSNGGLEKESTPADRYVQVADYIYIFLSTGISDTVPHRLLLQAGSINTMITRHHHHHFPTLSLEHLRLSLKLPT
jgi:hypothetical protein